MTAAQLQRLYFPAWRSAAAALGWTMLRGRLAADLNAQQNTEFPPDHPLRDILPALIARARALAAQDHRAPAADDLRHACNLWASDGRHPSAGRLTNTETSRVVVLFDLLSNPDNLAALARLDAPAQNPASLIAFLRRHASEDALRAIARNAFDTENWLELPPSKLGWILLQVRGRHPADDPF